MFFELLALADNAKPKNQQREQWLPAWLPLETQTAKSINQGYSRGISIRSLTCLWEILPIQPPEIPATRMPHGTMGKHAYSFDTT